MTGLRTLVVDDNATARTVLSKMVRALGWRVDVAGDVLEAMLMSSQRAAAGELYDVVFIDGPLPGLDEWSSTQRSRLAGGLQPAVVTMVTAQARETLTQRSRERRSTDADLAPPEVLSRRRFVVKPVTASMLVDAVADARRGEGAERRQRSEPLPATGCLAGLRLLVVEDNANNRQVAQELLMAEGAEVVLAENGEQGVRAVFDSRPTFDAVLMDLQMPVMDGYTATARIRERPGFEALPIIAMTANAMATDRQACLDAGMSSHVGKPFELADLVSALRHHTGRSAAPAGLPSAVTASSGALPDARELGGLEVAAAIRRLGGNAPVYGRMLRGFLKDLPQHLTLAEQQVRLAQWPAASMSMHALKGLAATIGARELQAAAALAETALERGPTEAVARELMARVRGLAEALSTRVGPWAAGFGIELAVPAAQGAAAAAPLRESLEALRAALGRSDMHALDLFEPLRGDASLRSLPKLRDLEACVDTLDFERAAALCDEWLREPIP
jgi:CheY-like chemotaxis protein